MWARMGHSPGVMAEDVFALDDVQGAREALGTASDARLWARLRWGESPLAAASVLAARGDAAARVTLSGAAAFATVDELAPLAGDAAGAEGLCAVMLAPWMAPAVRVAAAEALGQGPATAAVLAALGHLAEGEKKPPWSQAVKAAAALAPGASAEARREAERMRSAARQVREGVRGVLRRQEFQREVAAGGMHPVVGMLVGDAGEFLAGLLPPIVDAARPALVPYLVTVLRGPSEDARTRVLAMFQRRWRPIAGPPLSAVVRTPLKGREATLGPSLVRALGSLGAVGALSAALVSAPASARAVALGALEALGARGLAEGDVAALLAALARTARGADPSLAARAEALGAVALTLRAGA